VNHSVLNIAVALAQSADEIADQFVAFPIFKRATAFARLSEIQRSADRLARNVTGNKRAMVNDAFRFRRFDPCLSLGIISIKDCLPARRLMTQETKQYKDLEWLKFIAGSACIAFATTLFALYQNQISPTTVALSFLLVILFTATFAGRNAALLAALLAALSFNYFFLPPYRTFSISGSHDWISWAVFIITAFVTRAAFVLCAQPGGRSEPTQTGNRRALHKAARRF